MYKTTKNKHNHSLRRTNVTSKIFLLVTTILVSCSIARDSPGVSAFSWSFGGGGETGEKGNENEIDSSKSSASARSNYYKNRDLQLDDLLSLGEEKCVNKPCVQSEQCCPGSVCVDARHPPHGGKHAVTGTCLPIYGVNEGDNCNEDDDCEPGLRCIGSAPTSARLKASQSGAIGHRAESRDSTLFGSTRRWTKSCLPPGPEMMKKQYNDECSTSGECDASHGLCCQLIKRHRMTPRRACLYFSDPKICLGQVDVTFARPIAYSSYYTPNEHEYFRARIG